MAGRRIFKWRDNVCIKRRFHSRFCSGEVGKKVKQDFNMIEAYDMTLEAVITKLMWLMGREEQDMQKAFYTQVNHDILFTKRG